MPLKVGELYATMRLENKDFDRALDESGRRFSQLGEGIKRGAAAGARVLTAASLATVGLGAAALKVGLDYNRMQQTSRAALKAMLGSTEAVNAQMAKLDDFAANSPFSKQVFLQAQQQMIGFGVAVDDVIPALDAVQNAVASMGGSNETISSITYALSQMRAQGKLSGETLRDLGIYGIDAATIVGEKMGLTGAEIRKMAMKPGGIPVDQVWDPLISGLTEKFGGATDNIKQQMDGAADRVKAAWRDVGSVMATPLIDPTSGGQLVEWANLFADGLRAVEAQAKVLVPIFWDRMGPGVDMVTSSLQKATAVITGWNARDLESSLDRISKYTPLIAGMGGALVAMGTSSLPVLRVLGISGLNPVVAGVATLVAFSPQLRGVGLDLLHALEPGVRPAKELAVIIGDFLVAALDLLGPALGDLLTSGADVAVMFLSMLVPAVSATAQVALPLIEAGTDLVSLFAGLPTPILATVAAFAAMKGLGLGGVLNGLAKAAPAALKPLSGMLETARLQMMYLKEGTSGFGAVLGPVKGAVQGLGTALKLAFISNAPLLALTAIIGALTFFSQKSAEAKARADSYRTALEGVSEGAGAARKALEETAREALVTGENMDWGWVQQWNSGFKTAADAVEGLGFSLSDFTSAVTGSEDDFNRFINQVSDLGVNNMALVGAASEVISKAHQQRNAMSDAERQLAQMTSETERAEQAQGEYSDILKAAAEAVDRLRSAEESLAAAKGDLVLAQYAANDALAEWVDRVGEAGGVQRDSNGELVRSGDAWRAFEEGAIQSRRALDQVLENMVKTGASQSELDEKLESSKAQWVSQAEALGLSATEAEAYWEALGGIPPKVSTKVELGTAPAQLELDQLLSDIQNSHGEMVIDASSSPAHAELLRALGVVEVSEGQFQIDANTDPATASLLMTLGVVDTSTGILTLDADNQPSIDRLRQAEGIINGTTGMMTIAGQDKTGPVRDEAVRRANAASGYIRIGAVDSTQAELNRILGQINGSTAWVKVRVAGGMTASVYADGGIARSYADGGVENHVAQIARPGPLRVWAEPETGGEAYIPLAMSKRKRSVAILDRVAQEFGYSLSGVRSYADGGVTGVGSAAPAPGYSISIGNITIPLDDLSQIQDLAEFVELLRVKTMMQGG